MLAGGVVAADRLVPVLFLFMLPLLDYFLGVILNFFEQALVEMVCFLQFAVPIRDYIGLVHALFVLHVVLDQARIRQVSLLNEWLDYNLIMRQQIFLRFLHDLIH